MKQKKHKKMKHLIYQALWILFISLFLASIISVGKWFYDNHKTKKLNEKIDKDTVILNIDDDSFELVNPKDDKESDYWYYIKMPLIDVDFQELLKKNNDTVAWIQLPGTNINYPVVQTTDNDYYLTHAFDKSYNKAGWVFSDYRNTWDTLNNNTIIYGHGRLDKTVFGSLKNILTKSWQKNKDNFIVKLSTPKENTLWQVFSIYTINPETYYLNSSFQSTEHYQKFLEEMLKRSQFDFNTTVDTNDKILTLSTCTEDNQGRVVLQAKLIKKLAK